MARTPDWFDRLPTILEALRNSPAEILGRAEIQALFATSERDSWRLLRRFGAQLAGDLLSVEKTSLLSQLETLMVGADYQAFRRRKERVADDLAVTRPATQARFHRIAGSPEFDTSRRLKNLPPDIKLEPGRLEVRFGTEEDLWWLLDQLADIAAQDEAAFRSCIEPFEDA